MWKSFISGILIIGLVVGNSYGVKAMEKNQDVNQLVKKAFNAQVKLSEKERDMKEIITILDPYFTNDLISNFLKENLVRTDHGYQTFGSDFAPYYVPFFSYDDRTKIIHFGNDLYVIEKFSDKVEGPVQYNNEYLGIKMVKMNKQWKIKEVLMKVPNEIIQQSLIKEGSTKNVKNKIQSKKEVDNKNDSHEYSITSELKNVIAINPSIRIPFQMMFQSFYPIM